MAGRVPERFVPLVVDAYIELGDLHPMAELLYYRMLQWAKANPKTEGVVPDHIARSVLARGMKPGVHLESLKNRGTIVEQQNSWFIRVWFTFNPTKNEITERQQARSTGAHIANHKQKRHRKPVDGCPLCGRSSDRYSDRSSERYSDAGSDAHSVAEQESFSSLARAKGTPTGRPKGGALRGATLWHTYTPQHHPTQDQLRDGTPAERLHLGWPFDPDKPWLGGHEDNGRIWRTWQMPPWSPHNPDRPQTNSET